MLSQEHVSHARGGVSLLPHRGHCNGDGTRGSCKYETRAGLAYPEYGVVCEIPCSVLKKHGDSLKSRSWCRY
jgi:hypothetical protein